jgi:hypothetical protein
LLIIANEVRLRLTVTTERSTCFRGGYYTGIFIRSLFKPFFMSNVTENLLVNRARGNVGKQYVYRTKGNKTIIAKMPVRKTETVLTEKQESIREKFAAASVYAQTVMSTEQLRVVYQKKANANRTVANLASRDYLKPPKVKNIDTENYTGAVGSVIPVRAIDDFRVERVHVKISRADGTLIEQGEAIQHAINKSIWNYTTQQNNANVAGTKILATAFDLPGNPGILEITV